MTTTSTPFTDKKRFYCVLDTETGGFRAGNHSLLTVAWCWLDSEFNRISPTIEFAVQQDNNDYYVTPAALVVNQINLIDHAKTAVPFKTILKELKNFGQYTKLPKEKTVIHLAGQNIKYDFSFLKAEDPSIIEMFDIHQFELSTIPLFFQGIGIFPFAKVSLSSQLQTLKLANERPHTASGDVDASVVVLQTYAKVFRVMMGTSSEIITNGS